MTEKTAYENALAQMENAFIALGKPEKFQDQFDSLKKIKRFLACRLEVKMDNGNIHTFDAFRSQHDSSRGPHKWGIRFHENVSADEVRALSIWMSLKCAVLDLPLGWGKWWVIVNPKELSKGEIERLSRAYVRAFFPILGPKQDIPAPDVNTNGEIMAIMTDEYTRLAGKEEWGTFTGKPLNLGGSLGRDTATAQGGFYVLETFLASKWESITEKTFAIQWAGNAGLTMAKLLENAWGKIVAISDSKYAIFSENWLSVSHVDEVKKTKQSLEELAKKEGYSCIAQEKLLELDVDVFIPAALENQITEKNASKIHAAIVLELANGPITPEADEILFSRNIPVIPDILANAWGVTVSYFEQVQNHSHFAWTREKVREELENRMKSATVSVLEKQKLLKVDLRTSCQAIALERILEAKVLRGQE